MTDRRHNPKTNPLASKEEGASADVPNLTTRRAFVQAAGLGAAALTVGGVVYGAEATVDKVHTVLDKYGNPVQGFDWIKASPESTKGWKPISDRKIRVGIVGYGFSQFGAAFGFQDHPNVDVVAVSDLFPDRCAALAKPLVAKRRTPRSKNSSRTIRSRRCSVPLILLTTRSIAWRCLSTASTWR
jgi:hypothetical protein